MKREALEKLLLLEVHSQIVFASRIAVSKLGREVPAEARTGYLTEVDIASLKATGIADTENPAVQKWMNSTIAKNDVLSYPPDGEISDDDAAAIESLRLSPSQRAVLERVVAEACQTAFFHFFCILDAVGDPEVTKVKSWLGAGFSYPRRHEAMLHDELGSAYYEFKAKRNPPQ